MERYQEIENSIITKYRKDIYRKFRKAIEDYELVKDGDRIGICISGGKDSMLLAKCFQEYQTHGNRKFELEYIVMNPGYSKDNMNKIEENARTLNIPIKIFEKNIFEVLDKQTWGSPCFLCSKMRRGCLYKIAEELECNKIALGHHYDDVLETMLLNIFYAGEVKTMMPKIHSDNFRLELIRPLYLVKEQDIISWMNCNKLEFLNCACKVTEKIKELDAEVSKRKEMKNLINEFRKKSEYVDKSIFHSMSNVNLNSMLGWVEDGENHNFLDKY